MATIKATTKANAKIRKFNQTFRDIMNKNLYAKLAVVLGGSLLGLSAHGQPSVSVGITVPTPSAGIVIHADADFYEPLTPHGEWVTVGSYGRCWRPARVEVGWRPY